MTDQPNRTESTFDPLADQPAVTVRWFAHPDVLGTDVHVACGRPWRGHGWIDSTAVGGEGLTVCPSSQGPFQTVTATIVDSTLVPIGDSLPPFVGSGRLMDALIETAAAHTYVVETQPTGGISPYIWCLCGWRSDEPLHHSMTEAGPALFVHLGNELHSAAVEALRDLVVRRTDVDALVAGLLAPVGDPAIPCDTCAGTGIVREQSEVGGHHGGALTCPDCQPLPVRVVDDEYTPEQTQRPVGDPAEDGLRARIEALVEEWRYKDEELRQEGYEPDPDAVVLDSCALVLRAALGGPRE